MSLNTFFSLTPHSAWVNAYDAANPTAPYASAYLEGHGCHILWGHRSTSDEIVLQFNPVAPGNQTINSLTDDFFARPTISLWFAGHNVSTNNQYLLLAQLNGVWGAPRAQFFVGTELVREVLISGDEQVALLMDAPGSGTVVYFWIRLASNQTNAKLVFKGLDCYLL